MMPAPMGNPLPPEIVVRPSAARYRGRWLAYVLVLAAVIALLVFAVVADLEDPARLGLIIGGAIALPIVLLSWWWQWRTWLDSEPALVLQRDQFRIRHKGEYVWIPWSDVESLSVSVPGSGLGRVRGLVFHLRADATTVLPNRPASALDRMFSWHAGALAYAQPGDLPPFDTVCAAAEAYLGSSRSGGRPR